MVRQATGTGRWLWALLRFILLDVGLESTADGQPLQAPEKWYHAVKPSALWITGSHWEKTCQEKKMVFLQINRSSSRRKMHVGNWSSEIIPYLRNNKKPRSQGLAPMLGGVIPSRQARGRAYSILQPAIHHQHWPIQLAAATVGPVLAPRWDLSGKTSPPERCSFFFLVSWARMGCFT